MLSGQHTCPTNPKRRAKPGDLHRESSLEVRACQSLIAISHAVDEDQHFVNGLRCQANVAALERCKCESLVWQVAPQVAPRPSKPDKMAFCRTHGMIACKGEWWHVCARGQTLRTRPGQNTLHLGMANNSVALSDRTFTICPRPIRVARVQA